MKKTNIFTTFMLIVFITFSCQAMERALTNPPKSSPNLIQRLFPSGLSKIATKFALITSIIFSPDVMGRSLTNPTTTLPEILQTPFNQSLRAVAVNPVKPEVALAGGNLISLVGINTPDEPDIVKLSEDYKKIEYLVYNPQGTLLLIESCTDLDTLCFKNNLDILNLTTKTIQHTYKNVSVDNNVLFNVNGTKVVMRNVEAGSPPIRTDIIWDIYDDQQNIIQDPGANGIMYISRLFNQDTFVMNGPNNTVLWRLDAPLERKKLDISPGNQTVFGDNETQLAFSSNFMPDPIMYVRNGRQTISIPFNDGIVSTLTYCPELKKFPFTIGKTSWANANSVNMLDPETYTIEKLYNLSSNGSVDYNFPTFSSDGCKLFVLVGSNQKTLQFYYIDLINDDEVHS